MKKLFLIIPVLFLLVGCGQSDEQAYNDCIQEKNEIKNYSDTKGDELLKRKDELDKQVKALMNTTLTDRKEALADELDKLNDEMKGFTKELTDMSNKYADKCQALVIKYEQEHNNK